MSKSSEELAAIMLSGYLTRNDLKMRSHIGQPQPITATQAAQLLKEWTKAIDDSKAHEDE